MDYVCDRCDYEEYFDEEYDAEEAGWLLSCDETLCPDCAAEVRGNRCEICHTNFDNQLEKIEIEMSNGLKRKYRICENCKRFKTVICEKCGNQRIFINKESNVFLNNTSYVQQWCVNCRNEITPEEYRIDHNNPLSYIRNRREVKLMYNLQTPDITNNDIWQPNLNPNYTRTCPNCENELDLCANCQKRAAEKKLAEETTMWVYDTRLRGYHDGDHEDFKRKKLREEHENPYLYYGMELELVFNSDEDTAQIAKEFIKATNGMFVAEFDRSVSNTGNGCEFITRPMSYKIWTSPQTEELLQKGFAAIAKYNPAVPQPDTCGIHVHMSRIFFERNTEKDINHIRSDLDWIFQVFQPEIEKFSDRNYTIYCASKALKLRDRIKNDAAMSFLTGKISLKRANTYNERDLGHDHHDAVTMTGRTIEIRTFKSTTNVKKIISIIEMCRAVAHAARNLELTPETTLGDILFAKDSTKLPIVLGHNKVDTSKVFGGDVEVEL